MHILKYVKLISLILLFITLANRYALAADAVKGKELAMQCSVCHGKLGIAKDPEVPNLAGQSALYLEKALIDYQKGLREDRRMSLMVQPLSKEDIKDLAAWYESIIVEVTEPAN